MAIKRNITTEQQLIPTKIVLAGDAMDQGDGIVAIQTAWRSGDLPLVADNPLNATIAEAVGYEANGITGAQVLEFIASFVEHLYAKSQEVAETEPDAE